MRGGGMACECLKGGGVLLREIVVVVVVYC